MRENPTTRRKFLERAGAGSLAAMGMTTVAQGVARTLDRADSMKITKIEAVTFRPDLHIGGGSGSRDDGAEFFWVRLHTDKSLIGTGETYPWDSGQVGALKDYST